MSSQLYSIRKSKKKKRKEKKVVTTKQLYPENWNLKRKNETFI